MIEKINKPSFSEAVLNNMSLPLRMTSAPRVELGPQE
jgi:hypothetical protein